MTDQDKLALQKIEEDQQLLAGESHCLDVERKRVLADLRDVNRRIAENNRKIRHFYTHTHPEDFGGEKF